MTREDVLAACESMPEAELAFPFGEDVAVFKLGGKMFALVGLDEATGSINLKVDPDDGVELRRQHPTITPGYHMNKRHWITVTLDGSVPDDLIDDLIETSYALIVSALPVRLRPSTD